jgi:hypothetical protein
MLRICDSLDDAQEAKAIRRNIDLSSLSSIGQRTRIRVGLSRIPGGLARRLNPQIVPESRQVSQWFLGEDHGFESCRAAFAIVRLYGR